MSSSSSSSLSRLLSQTKISTFDPKLPQIYTSPKAYASRGDWGLSKPIPPSQEREKKLEYLSLSSLESDSGHVPWKPDQSRTRFLKRFKENPIRFTTSESRNNQGGGAGGGSSQLIPGSLGPRPRSVFDKHSYRPLPIESLPSPNQSESLSEQEKLLLQSKRNSNRSGYGYLYSQTGDLREIKGGQLDPLGPNVSDYFSYQSNLFPNYNLMTEKQFERFLEKLRMDEHGLGGAGEGGARGNKEHSGSYRKELEKMELNKRRNLLNNLKEKAYRASVQQVNEARETGSTPTANALFFSSFDSSKEIPNSEFLNRLNPESVEMFNGLSNESSTSSGESSTSNPSSSSSNPGRVEIDLWDESRKINTFNSADYLRKTLSFLESCDPSSTKLPTSSLVGGGGSGPNKTNSTGTKHSFEGLQYSNPDKIYTSRLSEPVKGRVLNDITRSDRNSTTSIGSFAVGINGLINELPKSNREREGLEPIDYIEGRMNKSVGTFRFMNANLQRGRDSFPSIHQSGSSQDSSSSSSRDGTLLPSLIKTRVRSSRESDNNVSPSNDTIPGSKSWLIENDGHSKLRNSRASSINYSLNMEDYNRPRRNSITPSSSSTSPFNLNRDRRASASANANSNNLDATSDQSSNVNTPTLSFPYSSRENQIRISRNTTAQNRRVERAEKGEESHQEDKRSRQELMDGLDALKI